MFERSITRYVFISYIGKGNSLFLRGAYVFLPLFQVIGLRYPGDACRDMAGGEVGNVGGTQTVELGGWFRVELVGDGTPNGGFQGKALTGEGEGSRQDVQ